jgi:hypothetical protein
VITSTDGIAAAKTGGTTYMGLIPSDPSAQTAECDASAAAVCHYSYSATPADCDNSTTNCTGYDIYAYLEGSAGGLNAGVICGDQNGVANTTCP